MPRPTSLRCLASFPGKRKGFEQHLHSYSIWLIVDINRATVVFNCCQEITQSLHGYLSPGAALINHQKHSFCFPYLFYPFVHMRRFNTMLLRPQTALNTPAFMKSNFHDPHRFFPSYAFTNLTVYVLVRVSTKLSFALYQLNLIIILMQRSYW